MTSRATFLDAVNWDFPSSLPGVGSSIHWYPGTFPNALPATFIQAFTEPGALVFDPYGGIGTTAFEAIRQQRSALSTDANPIATLVAAFSCALVALSRTAPDIVDSLLKTLGARIATCERSGQSSLALTEFSNGSFKGAEPRIRKIFEQIEYLLFDCIQGPPNLAALTPWFHEKSIIEALDLYGAFADRNQSPIIRIAGFVMVSAIMRPLSSQTASWGHVADNVLPKELVYKSVALQCKIWLSKLSRVMRETKVHPVHEQSESTSSVVRFNWLNDQNEPLQMASGSVDLMVTSPPYASAIDYTLSQRLSHYLAGYSDVEIKHLVSAEIGARRQRFHIAQEEVWATHLASSLESQLRLMKDSGVVCVVLPHKDAGRRLGEIAFESVLKDAGWRQIWAGSRSIRQSRTRQSWTSIQKETLLVFGGRKF